MFDQGQDIAEEMQTMTAVDQLKWEPTFHMSTYADINIATRRNKQYERSTRLIMMNASKKTNITTTRSWPMPYYVRDAQK